MNCRYFQEHLTDLLAGELSAEEQQQTERHMADCPDCAAAYRSAREALDAATPHLGLTVPASLKDRILEAARTATEPAAPAATFRHRTRFIRLAAGALSAAAVVVVALVVGFSTPARAARNCFRQAVTSMSELKSLSMELQIRTRPQENFAYTNPELDFVPHTLQVVYTPTLMWRIEKPARKALFDGKQIYQWFGSGDGFIHPGNAGILEGLSLLIDPRMLMLREQEIATSTRGATYTIVRDSEGVHLTITAPAQGDYRQSDYLLNSSITESDTRREYTFDSDNGRLLAARITAITDRGERPIVEVTRIAYDHPIDTAALTALPEGIVWNDLRKPLTGNRLTGIDAHKAAEVILQAMTAWDTTLLDEALFYYGPNERETLRTRFSGAVPTAIAEPVRSGEYPGMFVPCKLLLRDGKSTQLMLALRNDNPQNIWLVDGGL